jgi:predicted regulator of Ras-like GTPase activity (Roadblock/LC7/MglB family)
MHALVVSSDSLTGLLVTRDGHGLSEAGDTRNMDTTALAALVAGMFSATREVARLVGETEFAIMLQQGQRRHIHISLVTDRVLLVLVFEDYQKIGRVRYEARKAGQLIAAALLQGEAARKGPDKEAPVSMAAFREYALNLIDRLFDTK